jgi:hypothetical protein
MRRDGEWSFVRVPGRSAGGKAQSSEIKAGEGWIFFLMGCDKGIGSGAEGKKKGGASEDAPPWGKGRDEIG